MHHLNRLQHVGQCDDQVTRLDHSSCLEQRKCAVEVALHVIGETKTEGYETPLKVQVSPQRC